MLWPILIIPGLIIVATIVWIKVLSNREISKQVRDFVGQVLSILLTVSLGFLIFLIEQQVINSRHMASLTMALKEEAKLIRSTGSGGVLSLFPHANINRAATSDNYSANITRMLLNLDSSIEEHNRLIMREDPNIFGSGATQASTQIYLSRLSSIDGAIYDNADYLIDCLETGTSKHDPACD